MATPDDRTTSTPAESSATTPASSATTSGGAPVATRGASATRTPAPVGVRPARVQPVPVVSPFGWFLILVSGIGLLVSTWVLYPIDSPGMWAGYRDGLIGTVVLVCAMWLNTSLPKQPALGLVALGGILTVLFAVFLDNPTRVFVAEMVFGVMALVGAALHTGGRRH
jgi:hypothetical protein